MSSENPERPERADDDDHDLLTFGEAGVRLHEEVRAQAGLVAELEADPDADADHVQAARTRLVGLREAAERNARQPITDANFERFFGYSGQARRNTT